MASRDEEFARFFHEFYPSLCRFLECLLGGRGVAAQTAQDLAQDAFLQLHRAGFENFPEGEARFWLFRVARNMALNELSKRQTRVRLFDKVVETFRARAPRPDEEFEMTETKSRVTEMLKTLPEHQRAALLLREQEELSYREIAGVLGVSEAKVKVDVFRARTAMRERRDRAQGASAAGGGGG
ncbi:MAG TPA: sigma-70 family RNA polymerase sigma factor [Pyrinomonadaceae bacterium]|jgi:RNA polymerase sigma-70 factor (ECF subfamily)|nr:sigma-70 family RNA polymerase sigma factor [Pyrinomonadaceae bacterium]